MDTSLSSSIVSSSVNNNEADILIEYYFSVEKNVYFEFHKYHHIRYFSNHSYFYIITNFRSGIFLKRHFKNALCILDSFNFSIITRYFYILVTLSNILVYNILLYKKCIVNTIKNFLIKALYNCDSMEQYIFYS